MPIPFLVLTPAGAQLAPAVALLLRRDGSRPVIWVVAGALVSLLGDLVGRIAATHMGSNLWVSTIDDPVMFTLYFAALGEWQVTELERTTVRIWTIAALVVYLLLTLLVEDVTGFNHLGIPMYAGLLMLGATWTLARRLTTGARDPGRQERWVWVLGGLAGYGAVLLVTHPMAVALAAAQRYDLFSKLWQVRAVFIDLAFVAITVGCAMRPAASERTP